METTFFSIPVPPERWGVSHDDLVFFRDAVTNAVRGGDLLPTARDPFNPEDNKCGPSVYTVAEQLILPRPVGRVGRCSDAPRASLSTSL